MEFIETKPFSRLAKAHLSDQELRAAQNAIVANPEVGSVVKHGGGIRKVRVSREHGGKSGGFRVLYYLVTTDRCHFLWLYPKNKAANVTRAQLAQLVKLLPLLK